MRYKGTLEIFYLRGKNKGEALNDFWNQVNEDGRHLYVNIIKMPKPPTQPKKPERPSLFIPQGVTKREINKALKIVSENDGVEISELRKIYLKTSKAKEFKVRIIGCLCAGDKPLCVLKRSKLFITEHGKKVLEQ